jgi:signal transduction histidine kinase
MNDLIDSLLEFSRTRESLRLQSSHPEEAIDAAIHNIRLRPEFRNIGIEMNSPGTSAGAYDVKKLERVFHNLLLNSCEAIFPKSGGVHIDLRENGSEVEIRIADDGRGVPEHLKQQIFEPFFTEGKANGTGLGLTIAQKIVQDHGGNLRVESTSPGGTVLLVTLPLLGPVANKAAIRSSMPAIVTQ